MGRKKGSKNKKNKDIPLSKETKKLIEQGLKEAKEGKLTTLPLTEINPVLKKTVNELTKKYGRNIIHFANEEIEKERTPSKIDALDKLITGFPAGAFSIIWGNKGSTKTTTALYAIAEAQRLGKVCLYIDKEYSYDEEWAIRCGVDTGKLLYASDFDNAEEAMDTIISVCKNKVVDLIVLDSVQALSPKGEQENKSGEKRDMNKDEMGLLARKLSKFFRISGTKVYRGKITFLLIVQTRIDLGKFIKLETISGGRALGHYATIIIKTYRAGKKDAPLYKFKINDKKKSFPIGFQVYYCLEKKKISKCAPETSKTRQYFYHEFGFRKPTDKEIKTLYADWVEMEKEEKK